MCGFFRNPNSGRFSSVVYTSRHSIGIVFYRFSVFFPILAQFVFFWWVLTWLRARMLPAEFIIDFLVTSLEIVCCINSWPYCDCLTTIMRIVANINCFRSDFSRSRFVFFSFCVSGLKFLHQNGIHSAKRV